MKKLLILGFIASIGIVCSGCNGFMGSELILEYRADTIYSATNNLGVTLVDLTENQDYVDHLDDIVWIDYISIGALIINNSDQPVSGQIYFIPDGDVTVDGLREHHEPAYTSPEVLPGYTMDSSSEINSEAYADFDAFITDGYFYVYVVGSQNNYDIRVEVELNIMVYLSPDGREHEE
jgi:hypothetical protein